jgi:hypothetical protein
LTKAFNQTHLSKLSAFFTFYNQHAVNIQVVQTQVGALLKKERKINPNYVLPRNMGELLIQSHLIELQVLHTKAVPVVLIEDDWFFRNAQSLAKLCVLISTEAFLTNAQRLGIISSAEEARRSIEMTRPHARTIYLHQSVSPSK